MKKLRRVIAPSGQDHSIATAASRKLWRRYVVGLSALALLIFAHHIISIVALDKGAQDEELINLSGQNLMLSQRILFLSSQYLQTGDAGYADDLSGAILEFENAHSQLLAVAEFDAALASLYAVGSPTGLDSRVQAYIRYSRVVISTAPEEDRHRAHLALVFMGRHNLMAQLNESVAGFEGLANARAEGLRRFANITLVMALLALVIELLVIVRPMRDWAYQAFTKLDREANSDALTGLLNRKRWTELLRDELAGLQSGHRIVVVAVDLDGFKSVNDALGHPAGDALLQQVANLLRAKARASNTQRAEIARIGGDEFFCFFVIEGDAADIAATEFAISVIDALLEPITLPMVHSCPSCIVSASFGYAVSNSNAADIDVLVSNADIALYHSKQVGKGRCSKFHPDMRRLAEHRLGIESDIRRGLVGQEFVPYFQPQYSLETGQMVGAEVLARWKHPKRGLLSASEFIPEADGLGLADAIDEAVTHSALDFLQQNRRIMHDTIRFAINTSPDWLKSEDNALGLISTVERLGLSPKNLAIEVLETVLLEGHGSNVRTSLRTLRDAGFGLVIDDFGSGYSSIETVADLEIQELKIDKSLVSRAPEERFEKILVATIAMARGLNIRVCAEGVETEQVKDIVKRVGCETAQGFFLAKPMDQQEFSAALARQNEFGVVTPFPNASDWAFKGVR